MSKIDEQLCFALYSAGHAFSRIYKPLLQSIGLTYPQYLVMLILWEADGCTVGAIAAELFLESSTLTPLLKRLETAGLLHRRRDAADERQVRISLTAEGRALQERAAHIPTCLQEALGGHAVDALTRLAVDVRSLRDVLHDAADARAGND